MRRYVLSAAVLLAVAFAAPSADDDTKYDVKVAKFAPKGKSVKTSEKTDIKSTVKVTDDNDNAVMDTKTKKTLLRVYVEKTIDVDDKANKQKKFTRKYEKAKDVENDESENKPYHGRTIVYELSDGTYKLSAEGQPELSDTDLKELSEEANKPDSKLEEALYPKKAVKVGESWKLPGKDVAAYFKDLKMDVDTVKGEGKLVKAYKKDGKQWGTLEYAITFKSPLGEVKNADGELKATIDQPLDASSTAGKAVFKMSVKAKQTVEKDCKKFNVNVAVEATVNVEATDVK
jgi:hypothetical protein